MIHLADIIEACRKADEDPHGEMTLAAWAMIDQIDDQEKLNDMVCWAAGNASLEILKHLVEAAPKDMKPDLTHLNSQAVRVATNNLQFKNLRYLVEEAWKITKTTPDITAKGGAALMSAVDWAPLDIIRYLVEDAPRILKQSLGVNILLDAHQRSLGLQDTDVSQYLEQVLQDYVPTSEEVEDLKRQWLEDPHWDIHDTEGFGQCEVELKSFQEKMERKWEKERETKDRTQAQKMGVSLETYRQIDTLERRSEQSAKEAKSLLIHYFDQAGIIWGHDNRSEIEAIVDNLVDAAAAKSTASILEDFAGKLV